MGTAHVGSPCRVIPLVLLLIPVLLQRLTHRPLWVIILHPNGIVLLEESAASVPRAKTVATLPFILLTVSLKQIFRW